MAKLQWLSAWFVGIRQGVCILYSDTKYILYDLLLVCYSTDEWPLRVVWLIDIKSALFTDTKTS